MELLKTTLSMARYYSLQPTDVNTKHLDDYLKTLAFRPIDKTADEGSWGFVDLFDPEKPMSDVFRLSDKLFLRLRIDTRKIPSAVLNRHFEKALAKHKEERGVEAVSRDAKQEIKEQVRLKLLPKVEPVPTCVMIIITPTEVWVTSTSNKHLDIVERILINMPYENSFIPVNPFSVGKIEEWRKDHDPDPAAVSMGQLMACEFMSRLYVSGYHQVHEGGLEIKDKVVLQGMDESMSVQSATVAEWPEVKTRLAEPGVTISQARLKVEGENGEHSFVLKNDWTVSSLKTPKVEADKDDQAGALLEKCFLLNEVFGMLDEAAIAMELVPTEHAV